MPSDGIQHATRKAQHHEHYASNSRRRLPTTCFCITPTAAHRSIDKHLFYPFKNHCYERHSSCKPKQLIKITMFIVARDDPYNSNKCTALQLVIHGVVTFFNFIYIYPSVRLCFPHFRTRRWFPSNSHMPATVVCTAWSVWIHAIYTNMASSCLFFFSLCCCACI